MCLDGTQEWSRHLRGRSCQRTVQLSRKHICRRSGRPPCTRCAFLRHGLAPSVGGYWRASSAAASRGSGMRVVSAWSPWSTDRPLLQGCVGCSPVAGRSRWLARERVPFSHPPVRAIGLQDQPAQPFEPSQCFQYVVLVSRENSLSQAVGILRFRLPEY